MQLKDLKKKIDKFLDENPEAWVFAEKENEVCNIKGFYEDSDGDFMLEVE